MRHFFAAAPAVPGLAGGVVEPAGTALLIAAAGPAQRDAPGARRRTRASSSDAPRSQTRHRKKSCWQSRSAADDEPQRIHALPRSGRGGWTSTATVCEEGSGESRAPKV